MTPAELVAYRKRLGLSQTSLAQLLGVTNVAVYLWESGRRKVPPFLERALRDIEQELAGSSSTA